MSSNATFTQYTQVVEKLYSVSLQHSGGHWGELASQIRQWLCVDEVSLIMLDETCPDFRIAEGTSMTGPDFQHYLDNIHADNVWVHGLETRQSGIAYKSCDLFPTDRLPDTRFYEEYLRHKQYLFAAGGYFQDTDTTKGMLTVYQSGSRGRVTSETLMAVQACFPHFQKAMELHRAIHASRQINDCFLSAFTAMNKAVLVVDQAGRILAENHLLDKLLPIKGLSVNAQRLSFYCPKISKLFSGMRKRPCSGVASHPHIVWLQQNLQEPPLKVTFIPVSESMEWLSAGASARVLVIVQHCFQGAGLSAGPLCNLWLLTESEADLAIKLAAGFTLRETADALDISHETARTHLKAVFHKSGTHSQNELIAAISALF
jgi:DNA-binding CsgD family transcriptional regulator/PAS domain-containing protein